MMSQFVAAKNPPWVRANAGGLVQPAQPGSSILAARQMSHASAAGNGLAGTGLGPGAGLTPTAASLAAGGANSLATAAAVVAAAQTQQAQQGPAVSASYGTGLAAITLTQSALQQGAMLQQGIAIPASLAATTQVANVNNGMVVEIARLPQPGVALPTSLATTQVATVSYPAPRLLAQTHPHQTAVVQQAAAVQQVAAVQQAAAAVVQQHSASQQHQAQQQSQQYKQRVFTGTVTKLHENFGFVDEDVFFQMSSVKGNIPKAGERVLVEATYNSSTNSPFKWNATRITLLPNQVITNQVVQLNVPQTGNNRSAIAQQGSLAAVVASPVSLGINVSQGMNINAAIANIANNQAGYTNVAQSGRWQVQQELAVIESLGQQQQRLAIQHNNQHPWMQELEFNEMMDKGPRMSNIIRRHNSPPTSRRDRERERDVRREDRRDRYRERERYSPPPRKRSRSPPRRSASSPPRRRLRTIPRYAVQIPKNSLDFKVGNVLELRKRYTNLYVPSDFCAADFLWQEAFPAHRPFGIDHQCNFHIVGKDVDPLYENDAIIDPPDADYGFSAKVMLMSIPSLNEIYQKVCGLAQNGDDGIDNFVHPARLISFLVGLKGKNETVAIGGPWSPSLDGPDPKDPSTLVKTAIRTCKALTGIDLSKCSQWYRFAEMYYRRGESSSHKSRGLRFETVVLFMPDVWSCLPTRIEWDGMVATGDIKKLLQPKLPEETSDPEAQALIHYMDEEEPASETEKKEPTHFSELDPKTIKVSDLKRELEARNLSIKGLKSQLVARLSKALKAESEKEAEEKALELKSMNTEEADGSSEEKKKEKEDDKKSKEEKEKVAGEKWNFPDSPAIVVQPSRTAKNGKFDCTVMSLSVLLDYRQEDNKEHSFEVSLFAELFNEMMTRDFAFRIYQAIVEAPENKDDEKDKKKGDKKEKKDEKEDNRRKDDSNENDSDRDDDESEDDDNFEDKREKRKRRKKKIQMLTHDPYLLLSFVYFDQTHCGYILENDLEELFYTLGLLLSRAQVRKLVQKVCNREIFHYRKLTDCPVDSDKACKNDLIKVNIEDLSAGNRKYISALKFFPMENGNSSEDKKEDGSDISIVPFQGALVDIGKLMEQVERSEKARLNTDESVKELQIQLENVNEATSNKEKVSQKLSHELEEVKQKLRVAEEELKRVRSDADRFHKTLCSLKEGLQSSLFLTDSALQKSRATRSRKSSPVCSESDSYNSINDNDVKFELKRSKDSEKESNGIDDSSGDILSGNQNSVKHIQEMEID